jgi:hypothetical protein
MNRTRIKILNMIISDYLTGNAIIFYTYILSLMVYLGAAKGHLFLLFLLSSSTLIVFSSIVLMAATLQPPPLFHHTAAALSLIAMPYDEENKQQGEKEIGDMALGEKVELLSSGNTTINNATTPADVMANTRQCLGEWLFTYTEFGPTERQLLAS